MPRNSSGNYTLPAGNPVIPNTLIETAWGNPTMADLGAEITNSLDRQGRGTMLAPLKVVDGTVVTPGFAFNAEASTGMYRVASHVLGLAVAGALILSLADAAIAMKQPVTVEQTLTVTGLATLNGAVSLVGAVSLTAPLNLPLGSAALPALTFTGDPNTGLYSPGADTIGWATNGAVRGSVNNAGNWEMFAPSSAYTLTLDAASGLGGLAVVGAAGIAAATEYAANGNVLGTTGFFVGQNSAGVARLYQRANLQLDIGTNGLTRVSVAAAGNVTINAPSAGNTLTVNQLSVATTAVEVHGAAGVPGLIDLGGNGNSFAGATSLAIGQIGDGSGAIHQRANLRLYFATNNAERVQIAAAGNVTINAPSSGTTLKCVGTVGLALDTTSAAQSAYIFMSRNAVSYSYLGQLGTAGDLINDSQVGDLGIRVDGHSLRICTNSGASSALVVNASGNTLVGAAAGTGTVGGQVEIARNGALGLLIRNGDSAAYTDFRMYNDANSGARGLEMAITGTAYAGPALTGGPSGEQGYLAMAGAFPLVFGTSNVARLILSGAGLITLWQHPTNAANTEVADLSYVPGGFGNVYTVVTASRSFNTNNTNSTGRPICVAVTVGFSSAGTAAAVVGGVTVATIQSSAGSFEQVLFFIVPPGLVYRVNTSGSPSKDAWAEM